MPAAVATVGLMVTRRRRRRGGILPAASAEPGDDGALVPFAFHLLAKLQLAPAVVFAVAFFRSISGAGVLNYIRAVR